MVDASPAAAFDDPAAAALLPQPHPRQRAWVEIDEAAIQANADGLRRSLHPGCALMAVVKADGYGHGHQRGVGAEVIAQGSSVGFDGPWGDFDPGPLARIEGSHRGLVIVVTRQNSGSSLACRSSWELAWARFSSLMRHTSR